MRKHIIDRPRKTRQGNPVWGAAIRTDRTARHPVAIALLKRKVAKSGQRRRQYLSIEAQS